MVYYIASDHAGFETKEKLKKHLKNKGISFEDLGTDSEDPVDYPDYAVKVAKEVKEEKDSRGILICGSGTGMSIAANRIKGIRAVSAYDTYSAEASRKDNDANVLCLRAREFPFSRIKKIFEAFHDTSFSGLERHKRRIKKLDEL